MYSKEEEKQLRLEFWDRFKKYSAVRRRQKGKPSRFIMNNTGIRQLKLKFHFDTTHALVGIDIETRNVDRRIELYGKLEELATTLESKIGSKLNWELEHILPTGKSISRVSTTMPDVNIYDRDCWPDVFPFLYKNMMKFESFFEEYRDFIR